MISPTIHYHLVYLLLHNNLNNHNNHFFNCKNYAQCLLHGQLLESIFQYYSYGHFKGTTGGHLVALILDRLKH